MSTSHNQVYLSINTPQQAFTELSLDRESFNLDSSIKKSGGKRKRGSRPPGSSTEGTTLDIANTVNEDEVRKKLSKHFMLLRDIKENERLRRELDRTKLSLQLYEEYKKQKEKNKKPGKSKVKKNAKRLTTR